MRLNRLAVTAAASALLLVASQGWSDPTTQPKGTAVVTGHVNDPSGKPAAKAIVHINPVLPAGGAEKTDDPATPKKKKATGMGPMATTDDNGDFKVEGLAAGRYTVVVNLKNVGRCTANVTLSDGQTTDLKLQLQMSKKKPAPTT